MNNGNGDRFLTKSNKNQRKNAMVFFLIRALLRIAQHPTTTRLYSNAWRSTSQRYVSTSANSLLQWRQSYHDMFIQHCRALATIIRFYGQYGGWTFESFCEMISLEIGFNLDGAEEMMDVVVHPQPYAQPARQLSTALQVGTLQVAKYNPRMLSASDKSDKEREVKMAMSSLHEHETRQFRTFEERFNRSRWGSLSQCISANITDQSFTPFTPLFFSEVVLGRMALCYLYSSFTIALNTKVAFTKLWKSFKALDCQHVTSLFDSAVFARPCRETEMLPHVSSCISKCLSPQQKKPILKSLEDKKHLLAIFAKCLFPPPREGRKRDFTMPGAMARRVMAGSVMAGRAMADDDDMPGVMAGPAMPGDMAGSEHDDGGELARAVAMSLEGVDDERFDEEGVGNEGVGNEGLGNEGVGDEESDMQGGKKLIHKNKRSKSNKRSKTNKRSKSNKRSNSNKRSKSMKRQ